MSATSLFRIRQDSKCLPSYDNLNKVPIVRRDLIEFPEDVKKTKNSFVYEFGFDALNYTDISFNGTNHTKTISYLHNETAKLFFTNDDVINCQYDRCELLAAGCKWPYTATPYLTIGKSFPWTVTANTNVTDGYNTTFCLKCSNAWDSI